MIVLNATEAQDKLCHLIDETAITHQPIVIKGENNNAILLSEDDWNAINETLYLLSIPQMKESIVDGIATDINKCSKKLDW
jgi:antitoxin YefM